MALSVLNSEDEEFLQNNTVHPENVQQYMDAEMYTAQVTIILI